MEENKNNIEKLNNAAESLPEVPRDPEGKIIIDQIVTGINEKGKRIIPDKILESYYKELPDDLVNESGTKRTYHGGLLAILGGDPEADKSIQYKGGKALQATLRQRRTFQEAISTVLAQKARKKHIEELGLDDKADNLDMIIASMLDQVAKGNVKAAEFIEYGAGEKPTEKIDASLSAMTPEQQKILEDIKAFNSNT
jgi:hypothetical protein